MNQIPSKGAESPSADQEIPRFLCNPILHQLNPVHTNLILLLSNLFQCYPPVYTYVSSCQVFCFVCIFSSKLVVQSSSISVFSSFFVLNDKLSPLCEKNHYTFCTQEQRAYFLCVRLCGRNFWYNYSQRGGICPFVFDLNTQTSIWRPCECVRWEKI